MAGRRCRVALAFSAFEDGVLPSVASFANGWVDDTVHQAETVHGPAVGALLDPVKGIGPAHIYGGVLGGPPVDLTDDGSDGSGARQHAVVILRDTPPRSGRVAITLGGAPDSEGFDPRCGLIGDTTYIIAAQPGPHTYNLFYSINGSPFAQAAFEMPVDRSVNDATMALCWDRTGKVWVEVADEVVIGPLPIDIDATSLRPFCQATSGFASNGGVRQDGIATLTLSETTSLPAAPARPALPAPRPTGWVTVAATPTNHLLAEVATQSCTRTFRLLDPSSVDFTVDGHDPSSEALEELRTEVQVFCDGRRYMRARVGPSSDGPNDKGEHLATFTGFDRRWKLDQRVTWPHFHQRFDGTMAEGLGELLADTMLMPHGDEGIRLHPDLPDGPVSLVDISAEPSVRSAIAKLVAPTFGDWDIDDDDQLQVWPDGRGTHRADFVAHYGATIGALTRNVDPATFANAIAVTGSGIAASYRTATFGPEGRFERQLADPTDVIAGTARTRADFTILNASTLRPSYTVPLDPACRWDPTQLWLGDTCQVVAASGRLNIATIDRVYEITVTTGPDSPEPTSVQVTFGGPRPNLIRRMAADRRRLAVLESR